MPRVRLSRLPGERVLVTGADGYLGRLLVAELERGGHEVATLDAGLYRAGLLEPDAAVAPP